MIVAIVVVMVVVVVDLYMTAVDLCEACDVIRDDSGVCSERQL
jgi:CheY-like chemotaxis protein